jgi:preprotein translocase subunit SecG
MEVRDYLNIVQIIISITIILVVLAQARGEGGFGSRGSGIVRTRRGVEKTLFQMTIVLVTVFIFVSILSVRAG